MSSAAKVGIFMLIVLTILGYFILKIQDINLHQKETKKVTAIFDSVAGLDNKSAVRVAGVRVGKVSNIKLRPDGRAQVTFEIEKDVVLHDNAMAKVANLGLLGEKYVELEPGSPNRPALPTESENIVLRGSQPPTIDDVTNQISAIATDVKAVTESLRHVMAGPAGQQRLEDIVENVRGITSEVRTLIAANRMNVDATMANARAISEELRREIPRVTQSIDHLASEIGGTVGENRRDVRAVVENLKVLSKDLETTSENLNAITGQVKSGEGTVGKLIYSNEAHDKLTAALASVEGGVNELKNTIGRAGRMQLDLGINSDYYAGLPKETEGFQNLGGSSRSAVWLRLTPNPEKNRFYNVELADDPRGHRVDKIFQTTTTDQNTGQTQTVVTHETRFDRSFLISAQAGWHLPPMDVRIGLFDSTGGAGVDYFYNPRIRITGEAFDFGEKHDPNPHIRLYGEYLLRQEKPKTPSIFVRSGVDNVLNKTTFIIGGGIRWRDDDLKYLLGSIPIK